MRWKEEFSFGISPVLRQNDDLCYVKLSQLINRTAIISEKQLRKKKKGFQGTLNSDVVSVRLCVRYSDNITSVKEKKNHD